MVVLINRTDALGDTLLTLPIATALKSLNRDLKVIFLVSPTSVPLLLDNPSIDEIWEFEGKGIKAIYSLFKK